MRLLVLLCAFATVNLSHGLPLGAQCGADECGDAVALPDGPGTFCADSSATILGSDPDPYSLWGLSENVWFTWSPCTSGQYCFDFMETLGGQSTGMAMYGNVDSSCPGINTGGLLTVGPIWDDLMCDSLVAGTAWLFDIGRNDYANPNVGQPWAGTIIITGPACDHDADGFDATTDCDDEDPFVNPAATELCCNGVDDDCNGIVDDPTVCAVGVPSSNYCVAAPNSVSATGATISASGSSSVVADDLVLMAGPVPVNEFGVFFHAAAQVQIPFGEGIQCAAAGLVRVWPATQADGAGTITKNVNLTGPDGTWIAPGVTRNFQCWYRDPAGGPNGYNLSDGLAVCFY